jgi:hypothetical protein
LITYSGTICKAYQEEFGSLTLNEFKLAIKEFHICINNVHIDQLTISFILWTHPYAYKRIHIHKCIDPITYKTYWKLVNKVRI